MPWQLYYPQEKPEEQQQFHEDLSILRAHPDVEHVRDLGTIRELGFEAVSTCGPFDPTAVVVNVWFVDELERTEDPALLHIFKRRQWAWREYLNDPNPEPLPPNWPGTRDETRDELIRRLIEGSGEAMAAGRARLAGGFPLRQRLDYQSIGRRTFLVEQLPEGALPIYDRDTDPRSTYNGQSSEPVQGSVPTPLDHWELHETSRVVGYGEPIGSGAGASISDITYQSGARIVGLTPTCLIVVGMYLHMWTSPHPGNNGIFQITEVSRDFTSVRIANPAAQLDYVQGHSWQIYQRPFPFSHDGTWRGDPVLSEAQGVALDVLAGSYGITRALEAQSHAGVGWSEPETDAALRARLQSLIDIGFRPQVETLYSHIEGYDPAMVKATEEGPKRPKKTGWDVLDQDFLGDD